MSRFLQPLNLFQIFKRTKFAHRYEWAGEGIKYPGFKYYPRDPDFKDPPYEPTKLFRVQRIKPTKGVPYYERQILKEFRILDEKHPRKCRSEPVVVKNIPENNQRLWRIKHLIDIQPITFPDGFPKDVYGAVLQENGELTVRQQLPSQELLAMTDEFKKDENRMDGDTLRRDSRKKWVDGWQ